MRSFRGGSRVVTDRSGGEGDHWTAILGDTLGSTSAIGDLFLAEEFLLAQHLLEGVSARLHVVEDYTDPDHCLEVGLRDVVTAVDGGEVGAEVSLALDGADGRNRHTGQTSKISLGEAELPANFAQIRV